jgi:hypothetical protein
MLSDVAILLDTKQFPFVFTMLDGQNTIDDLERHIAECNELFARKQMFAQVTWLKGYTRDSKQNERVARWFKESSQSIKDCIVGVGHISSSAGFRFALSAVFLIKPMPCPHSVDSNFDAAIAFVRKQAGKRGLKLPETVQRPWPDMP